MNSKLIYLLSLSLMWTYNHCEISSPFIIEQKTESCKNKNEVKEAVGEEIRAGLKHLSSLQIKLGSLQQKYATVQKRLFEKGESLLENKAPFKKASKEELAAAHAQLQELNKEITHLTHCLSSYEGRNEQLTKKMECSACLSQPKTSDKA